MEVVQIPVLNDNYIYILICDDVVAVVDPAEAEPVNEVLKERGLGLDYIINTHHHWDHVGGNKALKSRWGCKIIGAANDSARIPGIDLSFREGDEFHIGASTMKILEVSGHTIGHIACYFESEKKLFAGDTLFAMGCGRLFEGSPEQMYASLAKLASLPEDTLVYCTHEYTKQNAEFALRVDPSNSHLKSRYRDVCDARAQLQPTVPFPLSLELKTNPFLRADAVEIRNQIKMPESSAPAVFAELRRMKDIF